MMAFVAVQAQEDKKPELADYPNNAITVSPAGFVFRTPTISYERKLTPRWAVEVHSSAVFGGRASNPNGVGMALDARWYFGYAYPVLFFLEGGVYGAYAWMTRDVFVGNDGFDIHTRPYTYKGHHIAPSLMAGFRLQSKTGIFAEFRLGIVGNALALEDKLTNATVSRSYLANYLGMKIGYAF